MKQSFIPFLIASFVILTSLSECQNPFSADIDAPISAEINGELYSSPGHKAMSIYEWAAYNGKGFFVARDLYSQSGKEASISLRVESDTLLLNHKYSDTRICFGTYELECINGWIEFTGLTYGYHHRVHGIFEFTVTNPETGEIDYYVTNGRFNLPYETKEL